MFALSLPIIEKVLRVLIVYIFLVIGLRLAGKRELAQLNPFDLVVLLTLSNTVQNAIIGNDNSVTGGIIGATALLLVNYLVVRFMVNHRKLEEAIEGEPDVLIDHGRIKTRRLNEEAISIEELEVAARKQGFAHLKEVEKATLEPGGAITFIGKMPSEKDLYQKEILERLERIERELAAIKSQQNTRP
jgi:uncharacterized membrane protein YcaP (DUF421 family)